MKYIMKTFVRYYSKTGNSKKLAERIAGAAGCEATTISKGVYENTNILFQGDCRGHFAALHKGKPDENDLKKVEVFVKNILKGKEA